VAAWRAAQFRVETAWVVDGVLHRHRAQLVPRRLEAELADLKDQGVLTDAEFEAEKAKILT
jgi:hypothetical protein